MPATPKSTTSITLTSLGMVGPAQLRLRIDHAGPFLGKQFLILVDAHSMWMEVKVVPSTATSYTIDKLRRIFATHGLPETIVSNNGTCFTSEEFKEFTRRNGIRHLTSAPYHPATNGLAERAVQTFKMATKKATTTSDSEISRFLFSYRNTLHTTTGVIPAELLLHRKPQSLLTMLRPFTTERVRKKQIQQEINHDVHARKRAIAVDDPVFIRNFRNTGKKGYLLLSQRFVVNK